MTDSETKKTEPAKRSEFETPCPETAQKIRSGALVGILVLMILYTAYFARAILIPMAIAFLFSLILIPAVARLARWRIPRPVGAVIVLVVAILEGQFLTLHIVGRRLSLSPVAVFVTLVVWGWLRGVVGAIIAVPLLASFKLMCEEIEPLHPISDFLTSYYNPNE